MARQQTAFRHRRRNPHPSIRLSGCARVDRLPRSKRRLQCRLSQCRAVLMRPVSSILPPVVQAQPWCAALLVTERANIPRANRTPLTRFLIGSSFQSHLVSQQHTPENWERFVANLAWTLLKGADTVTFEYSPAAIRLFDGPGWFVRSSQHAANRNVSILLHSADHQCRWCGRPAKLGRAEGRSYVPCRARRLGRLYGFVAPARSDPRWLQVQDAAWFLPRTE